VIRTHGVRIWLAVSPVDMRRSFDALAEHVRTILAGDPMSGHLFVFRNRNAQRVKILWWDGDGFALYYKRLERGTFQFPSSRDHSAEGKPSAISIESAALMKLLSGRAIE
jgi:transposase